MIFKLILRDDSILVGTKFTIGFILGGGVDINIENSGVEWC